MSFDNVKITVIRSKRKTLSIQVKYQEIIARAPLKMKDKEIFTFIDSKEDWIKKHLEILMKKQKNLESVAELSRLEIQELTEKAKEFIPKRVECYADRIGVTYNRITIRCQKTRWGSCSSKGNLNFNCLLMLFPVEVIDCVVVHELCHRKQMNHSSVFYKEIEKVFPDYKKHHNWLKDNGGMYLARLK